MVKLFFMEKVRNDLECLDKKLEVLEKVKRTSDPTGKKIKSQSERMEKQIKKEFEKLHQFLRDEEAARIAALKEEEKRKKELEKNMVEALRKDITSLSQAIREDPGEGAEEIDMTKHLDCLKRNTVRETFGGKQSTQRCTQIERGSCVDYDYDDGEPISNRTNQRQGNEPRGGLTRSGLRVAAGTMAQPDQPESTILWLRG
ncbi:hypothetical protein AAFF_G00124570 [Aldrovandia affinis]|uniref:Uncharacterized protein n=1 Tax=Aldrovandia affinis TaxID=143900 RepID=A0AAD7RRV9_9TELE|nr:hypothetical protein AAFF_G00124570 [Aldrovandia affinis]